VERHPGARIGILQSFPGSQMTDGRVGVTGITLVGAPLWGRMFHVKHLRPDWALSRDPVITGVERGSRCDFLHHHKVVGRSHKACDPKAQLF
jgi:hypothetical protein